MNDLSIITEGIIPVTTTETESIATDRCTATSGSGRQCRLAPHESGKHVFMIRKPAGEAPKIPAGLVLTAVPVASGEVTAKARAGGKALPRDADQVKIDKDAHRNYEANVKAGKHSGMKLEDVRVSEYVVPPAAVDAVLAYLRRAADAGGPGKNGLFRYRRGTHASGNTRVQWAFLPPDPNPKKA